MVGIDGSLVLVRHGGQTIKVHKCRERVDPNHQPTQKNEINGETEPTETDNPMKTNETNRANSLKDKSSVCLSLRAITIVENDDEEEKCEKSVLSSSGDDVLEDLERFFDSTEMTCFSS